MRLWTLDDLFKEARKLYPVERLIHVCDTCGHRTPALSDIQIMPREPSLESINTVELKENLCDECNHIVWAAIAKETEDKINDCKHCGGGRCKHYDG